MSLITSFFPNVPRINGSKVIPQTPTISTSAYVSGYQLGGIMSFFNCCRQDTGCGYGITELIGVTILDKSKQNAAIDLWLFNTSPTITSSDHSAFSMTAANQAVQCIGVVQLGLNSAGTSNYSGSAICSVSSNQNLNKMVQIPGSYGGQPVATSTTLYAVAVVRSTPTYTSTTDLQFQLEFFLD